MYHRPADNCCIIYHGAKFTDKHEKPLCWNMATSTPLYDQEVEAIKGVDCGKHTWVDFASKDNNFMLGTAGRQNFDLQTMHHLNKPK